MRTNTTALEIQWVRTAAEHETVAQLRRTVYGEELGLLNKTEDVFDRYDQHSRLLVVYEKNLPVATSRFTIDTDGPLEIDDVVHWRAALPRDVPRDLPTAEWSRNIVKREARGRGLLAAMWPYFYAEAKRRGARMLCGACVEALKPSYERFGFTFLLNAPFRVEAFHGSPIYYPAYRYLGES